MIHDIRAALVRLREAGAENVRFVFRELSDMNGVNVALWFRCGDERLKVQTFVSAHTLEDAQRLIKEVERAILENLVLDVEQELCERWGRREDPPPP